MSGIRSLDNRGSVSIFAAVIFTLLVGSAGLVAPSSGSTEDLAVLGPTSSTNTADASFAEGATATSISGVFYVPNGAFTESGGASVGNGTGQCLEVIASEVSLSGGTTLATTCTGLGGASTSSGPSVLLVQ